MLRMLSFGKDLVVKPSSCKRIAAVFVIAGLVAAASVIAAEPEIVDLGETLEPLKESFNEHKDAPRFIALLSPT